MREVVSIDFSGSGKMDKHAVAPVMAHNLRRKLYSGLAVSENVDVSRSGGNFYWCNPRWDCGDGSPDWERAVHDLRTDTKTIRKDAVWVRGLVLQVSPAWVFPKIREERWDQKRIDNTPFTGRGPLDMERVNAWRDTIFDWAKKKYGDTLLSAQLHVDERVPHIHLQVCPIVEGRLCAKQMITQKTAKQLVSEVAEVCKPLGLSRATDGAPSTGQLEFWWREQQEAMQAAKAAADAGKLEELPEVIKTGSDREKLDFLEKQRRSTAIVASLARDAEDRAGRAEMEVAVLRRENEILRHENARIEEHIVEQTCRVPLDRILRDFYDAVRVEQGAATSHWLVRGREIDVTTTDTGDIFVDNCDSAFFGRRAIELITKIDTCDYKTAVGKIRDHYGFEEAVSELRAYSWHTFTRQINDAVKKAPISILQEPQDEGSQSLSPGA